MKKVLSLFLAVCVIASTMCGVFSFSASAETADSSGLLPMDDGSVYKKIDLSKTDSRYRVYGSKANDTDDAAVIYDNDLSTSISYRSISSAVITNDATGVTASDGTVNMLLRVYYSDFTGYASLPDMSAEGVEKFDKTQMVPNTTTMQHIDIKFPYTSTCKNIKATYGNFEIKIYEVELYREAKLSVSKSNITDGATGVTNINGAQPLTVTFSDAVDTSTVTRDNVKFTSSDNEVVAPVLAHSDDSKVLKFDLKDLKPNTAYTFTMTDGVKNTDGISLKGGYTLNFTTGDIAAYPYYDGRVIKEVTDFSTQVDTAETNSGLYAEYSFDFKKAVPVSAISVKMKSATDAADSTLHIKLSDNGALKNDFNQIGDITVKNNTADIQRFFVEGGESRFFWLNGYIDVSNIEYIKVYSSVDNESESGLFKVSLPMAISVNNAYYNAASDTAKMLHDGKFKSGLEYANGATGISSINISTSGIRTAKIAKVKVWYENNTGAEISMASYWDDKWHSPFKFPVTNGAVACAEYNVGNTTIETDLSFMGGNDAAVKKIEIHEVELYISLDDSASFVSATSSTDGVSATELAKVYNGNAADYCDINAKDIILKLDKPTLASAIKIAYNDESANCAVYTVYGASVNDDSAYEKIGEVNVTGDVEEICDTGIMEFPEKNIRYVKIVRPQEGTMQFADVKVYAKNALAAAPEGQHWENIIAGLNSSAVTAVDGTGSSVDSSAAYRLTDGKFDDPLRLSASGKSDNNASGAQYDIDLGDVYTIGGANMGWIDNNNEMSGCFALYGSKDGENYTKLTELITGLKGTKGIYPVLFAQGNYRYLRLVKGVKTPDSFTKTDGVVCGYGFADYADITEFEVYGLADDSTGLVISDNNPEKVSSGYNWSASVKNYTGEKKTYTVISACYGDNGLISCKMNDTVTSDAFDNEKVLNISGDIPSGTKYVRVFLWDGTANAKPLMQERTLTVE